MRCTRLSSSDRSRLLLPSDFSPTMSREAKPPRLDEAAHQLRAARALLPLMPEAYIVEGNVLTQLRR